MGLGRRNAMTAPVTVSTSCFAGYSSLNALISDMRNAGIDDIELSAVPPHEAAELESVVESGASLSVHNYFPPVDPPFVLNLASDDPETLERSREMARRNIDLTRRVNGGFYAVHAGFGAEIKVRSLGMGLEYGPPVPFDILHGHMVSSLRHLCDYAAPAGVVIAVENHPVAERNLIDGKNILLPYSAPGQLSQLIDDVDRTNIGILMDFGHLKVTATTLGFDGSAYIEHISDRIVAFHVSDNDGLEDRNWPVSDGSWALDMVRRTAFRDRPKIIEVNFDAVEDARRHRDWLSEQLNDPSELPDRAAKERLVK